MSAPIEIQSNCFESADQTLGVAIGKLETAIVLGFDHNGNFWFSSNTSDPRDVFFLLELCRKTSIDGISVREK